LRDLLPDASIGISIPAIAFLDQAAVVAAESGLLHPDNHYQADGVFKMDILNLYPVAETKHEGLLGQLIYTPDYGNQIRVEGRAHRWSGDHEPTYELYVEALEFIFRRLLRDYYRKHGSRYRLTIEAKDACEPTLSPRAQKAFDSFVGLANKDGLHPLDWERFYRFARVCHVFHVKTNEEDVFRLLVHAEFSEQYARELATVFGRLRDFQRL